MHIKLGLDLEGKLTLENSYQKILDLIKGLELYQVQGMLKPASDYQVHQKSTNMN